MRVDVTRFLAAFGLAALLAGCAATTTAISKRNLDVQTKMSDSIFLEPVSPRLRTVYVQVRNTSDKPELDVGPAVKQQITARGYVVVEDPAEAHFMLQANVLQAGKSSESATESALGGGFGSVLVGAAAGAAVGTVVGQGTTTAVVGGLLGAAGEAIAGAFVQDVTFSIITDVQVSERVSGHNVTQTTTAALKQGSSGTTTQTMSDSTDLQRYRTRVASTANKVNLSFEEASPELVAGLSRSIAGIF